jgi:hypothetical protein
MEKRAYMNIAYGVRNRALSPLPRSRRVEGTTNPAFAGAALLLVLVGSVCTSPVLAGDSHGHAPDVFGFDLAQGWFDPAVHSHLSRRGTPFIHPFRVEPAFTRRDVLLDYSFRSADGEDEHEIEAELEWAFTRRLGLVLEIPYLFVDSDGEPSADGFGNLAVSPRLLLAEYERFLLAFSFEVEIPTGDSDAGLAEDEAAVAPSVSTWIDLGDWWAANAQSGIEHATESGDSELFIRAALIRTLTSREEHHDSGDHDHEAHGLPLGSLSLILEADLAVDLSGEEDGDWLAEGIVGAYYGLGHNLDVRAGYQFPLSASQELNGGVTCGLIWHF